MKRLFAAFICILCYACTSTQKREIRYFVNPVISGDLADPTLLRIGETYYAAGTSSEWAPFYPLYSSTDLVNWTQMGHIFEDKPEWTVSSFWAPELFYHNNKVYCYYTARRKTDGVSYIGVATTTDLATERFTDHGLLLTFGTEAIDAFVFDDNEQLYITWKAYGLDERPIELMGSKLSDDGLHLEGEPFSLLIDNENTGMEGQYHFRKGDYYYILYSAHGCCGPNSNYDVYAARSKSFKGPYETYEGNPVLHGGGDFISCGHGTAATTPDGRMYYMCHAYLSGDRFYMGRQAILQEMIVGDDNWIRFAGGSSALIKQPMPFGQAVQENIPNFEDDFKETTLKKEWAWNYVYADIDARITNNQLVLSGKPKDGNRQGTVLCLRPAAPHYSFETQIAGRNNSSKGLTIYGDDENMLVWVFANDKVILKMVSGNRETILGEQPVTEEAVSLKIEITKGYCATCYWSKDGNNWEQLGDASVDCSRLVRWDRIARPGLIHIGDPGKPAVFSYFKLKNLINEYE
jgi:beta-xylosidase